MNMDLDDFDIGPLTWVKGELDNALNAAQQALQDWNGEDLNPLKIAAAHLHQVYGALQIVDLQGVSLLTAETEHLLLGMSNQLERRTPAAADAALRAIEALKSYLDNLVAGAPHAELQLTPVYQAVVIQRGGEPPAPSDLFFPNTDARPPKRTGEIMPGSEERARAIHAARGLYQRGLLQVLQNKDPVSGLSLMNDAIQRVENLAPSATQYSFWWTTGGLIDALRRGGIESDLLVKRLCGRIDMQMRRVMEGSQQLAERLFRDVLFHIAQDKAPSGRSAEVQTLFQLQRYFPAAVSAEDAEQRPFIAALKEHFGGAKDHWIRYCGGHVDSLEPFQQAATHLFEAAVRLPNPAMKDLTRIVQAVAKRMPGAGDATHNESLQIELATALLLGQNAADHYSDLNDEFTRQAEIQAMRVQAALDPNFDTSSIPQVDLLDEISRAAQEKLLMAQVTHEIQANLHQVEESLDKFFRNADERADLPRVPGLLKQILGACHILQLDVAAQLVQEAMTRIGHFNAADVQIPPENLNWVAEALSTLGLYVDALRYGRDDAKGMAKLLATPEAKPLPKEESVEHQVQAEAVRLREAVATWASSGGDPGEKDLLKQGLTKLARDADLIGDSTLRGQADHLLKALDNALDQASAAAQSMSPASISAPSEQAQRLAQASSETVDNELLAVYIEEANEVIGAIDVQISRLHVSPYDHDAFNIVRRGFHTLKGSGRMVGLTDLADPAWEAEQTLNQWLRDERAPTPDLLSFLEDMSRAFQVWVSELEQHGKVRVEAAHLVNVARRLRGEVDPPPPAEEPSPPKPEAGEPVESSTAAGTPEAADNAIDPIDGGEVRVGEHTLPAELFSIFSAEATQRLADLNTALREMAGKRHPAAWEAFIRAAHTLAGISRTTGFTPLAEAAHAVERWAGAWPDKTLRLQPDIVTGLEAVISHLDQGLADILARLFPQPLHAVEAILKTLECQPECLSESIPVALPVSLPETLPASLPEQEAMPDEQTLAPAQMHAPTLDAEAALEAGLEASPGAPSDDAPPETELIPDNTPLDTKLSPPATSERTSTKSSDAHPARAARDDLDEQLLPIFLEEAAEILPRIGESLRNWRAQPSDVPQREALKRALHTLKGSSRMAGAMVLGERVHELESEIIELGEQPASMALMDQLETAYDHIHDLVEHLKAGPAVSHALAAAPVEHSETATPYPATSTSAPTSTFAPAPQVEAKSTLEDDLRLRQALRLKADVLDTLLNEAGEVSIARARIENVLTGYKQTAQELAANVDRLRAQLRELEIQAESQMRSRLSKMDESQFDPLEFDRFSRLQELTRQMAESVNDVSTAQDNLLSGLTEADSALIQQSRMTRTLQQELMHMRMVPLNTLAERLYRVVRQSAKEAGRRAQLELEGGQTELDRAVLDKISAPLEHLVRNAVAHGIEPPDVRKAGAKPEYGEIRLGAKQEGNEIVLTLADDGGGVNTESVRAQAVALGWLPADQDITAEQIEAFLFRSGFSTAAEVTELAGRGIGLDVVKNEIARIGGRVRMTSQPGAGTMFTIRLPLTLALTQVVLAKAGDQTWALPANLVTLVREVKADQIQALHEQGYFELDDERFPLRTLAELVDTSPQPIDAYYRTLLLLKAGESRLALRIDAMEGNLEAVVKPISTQLARISGISGATVLGDGRVALILNPFLLAEQTPERMTQEEVVEVDQAPLVMVVDDSLTVRKITSRLLERSGYRVSTAKDGVEALEVLEGELPAVMLLDIEMPRMDGFEVTQHVRSNARTAALPIIMITSRTADKHRDHAVELGVDAYMGKPYQEDELLSEIKRLSHSPSVLST